MYIAGKYARELNEMEKEKLEEFSKQMVAQNLAAMAAANATAQVFGLISASIHESHSKLKENYYIFIVKYLKQCQ